jgi:RNA polymerase sigma-70 factor (ECF subfamily)
MGEPEDRILIQRARGGDRESFEALVRRYLPRVAGVAARALGGDRHEALDVAQEAFVEVWRILPEWKEGGSLFSWLYRTALNLASHRIRRRRRLSLAGARSPETTAPAPPADELQRAERADALRRALEILSEQQREVFLLRHEYALPLAAIARRLGLAEGTVKSHLHRALLALRQALSRS